LNVSLTGITSPSAETDVYTVNDLVAYIARVSNPANQNNTKTAAKLLRTLIKGSHWSPLEMVHIVMKITTTRDIGRQIIRHRSFAFQEFSQRYAVSENSNILREARLQDHKNRQNSIETKDKNLKENWHMLQVSVSSVCRNAYNWALDNGIAKEQARVVLPEGNTETTMFMAGSLRSWVHYCMLRQGNGTQKEHIEVANECWEIIRIHFPDIVKAIEDLEEAALIEKYKANFFDWADELGSDASKELLLDYQKIALDKMLKS
jgi:thymidylate synthase (FAD)